MNQKNFYNKSILSNGVRLVTEKIPTVRSVALGVWVNVGGRDETEANQGISHFLEHMIFKGTKKRSQYDIALEIESVGGAINAMTMNELTCFHVHMLDENIDRGINVLSDIVNNSIFPEPEIAKEKFVVIEEIKGQEDEPGDLIFDYFSSEVFKGHPLGLPILGTRETVSSFTSNDIRKFIDENYTSDRIVIAAAGNIEHDELKDSLENSFNFPAPENKRSTSPPGRVGPAKKSWERPIKQAHIITGCRSYKYTDAQKYPYFLLANLLGGGMSSRLFQSIREKHGLAYAVYSFSETLSDTGMFGVYIGADKVNVDHVLELTYKELDKLSKEPLTTDELLRIKNQLKGNLMLGLESTSSRMHRLAKMEVYLNNFVTLDEVINKIDKVTSEQIMQVAENLARPEEQITVIFIPAEDIE